MKCFEMVYLLGEKYKRQQYDVNHNIYYRKAKLLKVKHLNIYIKFEIKALELTKRAIQLEKSKSKNRSSNTVATGLGGSM